MSVADLMLEAKAMQPVDMGEGEIWVTAPEIGTIMSGKVGAKTLTDAQILTASGWTFNPTYMALDTGTDATSAGMSPVDYPFYGGAIYANRATAPFRVSIAGVLNATGATISGTITATAGAIGGFDIGADYVRDVANSFGLASTVTGGDDVRFWAGATFANRASAPAMITEAGAATFTNITATGGTIGGWTLAATTISGGGLVLDTANLGTIRAGATDYMTGNGIWITMNTNQPRVRVGTVSVGALVLGFSWDGAAFVIKATNFTLDASGNITATGGTIGGWTLAATTLTGGNVGLNSGGWVYIAASAILTGNGLWMDDGGGNARIRVGTVSGGALVKGFYWDGGDLLVYATNFTLDASGNLTCPAGATITAGTIRTAASGARVVFDSTGIKWYDATTQRGEILATGAGWLGASGSFSWTALGVVSMDGAFINNSTITGAKISTMDLTSKTLTADTGTIGGWTLGATTLVGGDVTLDSAGKISLAVSATTGPTDSSLRWIQGANLRAWQWVFDDGVATNSKVWGYTLKKASDAGLAQHSLRILNTAGTIIGELDVVVNASGNAYVQTLGYFYPGTLTATQATRYISDDGTYTFVSGGLKLGGAIYLGNQTTRSISDAASRILLTGAVETTGDIFAGDAIYPTNQETYYLAKAAASGLTTNGRLGVGIGSNGTVSEQLHVSGGYILVDGTVDPQIKFNDSGATYPVFLPLAFYNGELFLSNINGPIIFRVNSDKASYTERMRITTGVEIGSPTGGDKGAGTLNATAVYDDGVGPLTDWLFDLYYDGRVSEASKPYWKGQPLYSLVQVQEVASAEHRLPWMPTRADFEKERSLGGMVTRLWEGQEYQQTYIFDQAQRIAVLETEVAGLRARLN